jgi:licheninase
LPQKQTYGNSYWPDNGEIDLMEQVGYDPYSIHSTVHTQAYNYMKHNQPTNAVIVNNDITDFNIYTLDWGVDKMEMFVGNEANPLQTRILVWEKQGRDWTAWYILFCFYLFIYIFVFHRPFDQPFFVLLNIAVGGSW